MKAIFELSAPVEDFLEAYKEVITDLLCLAGTVGLLLVCIYVFLAQLAEHGAS